MINKSGPNIEPCGTPVVINDVIDLKLSISVYYLRFSRWLLNNLRFISRTP